MTGLRRIELAGVFSFLALMLGGCMTVQRGTTEIKWEPGQMASRTIGALDSGKYALYQGSDYKPKIIVSVQKNEKIGFERTGGKQVTAVAGSYHEEFDAGNYYYWNYRGK